VFTLGLRLRVPLRKTKERRQRSLSSLKKQPDSPAGFCFALEWRLGQKIGIGAPRSLSEDNFRQVFPGAGWEITYLQPNTYQVNISMTAFEAMLVSNPDKFEEINSPHCGSS